MNGADNLIRVFRLLVSQMTPVIQITENVADGDNWKLSMCRTYWLTTGMTIQIGGEDYRIESFVFGEYIVVSGPSQPVVTSFTLEAPGFYHGARRKVNADFKGKQDLRNCFVYLPVTETITPDAYDSDIAYTADIKPLFLRSFTKSRDTTEQQQAEVIEPMYDMAELFIELITEQGGYFNKPKNVRGRPQMNFGDQAIWGSDKMIFDQPLSGVEIRFPLEVLIDGACRCDDNASVVCAPVQFYLDNVFKKDLPSGSQFKVIVKDTNGDPVPATFDTVTDEIIVPPGGVVCQPVTATFNDDPIEPTPAGGNKDVIVETLDAAPIGTVTEDTAGSLKVQVPNAQVNVNGDAFESIAPGSTLNVPILDTGLIPVGTNTGPNVQIDDVTMTFNASPITNVKAEQSKDVEVVDSGGDPTGNKVLDTAGQLGIVISDHETTLNGNSIANNKAQTNKAIEIEYANGDPVLITTVTNTQTLFEGTIPNPKNTATGYKSGDSTDGNRGRGTDWFNLSEANYFGTMKRFTGTTGGYESDAGGSYFDVNGNATTYALAFPNDWVIDWAYWDQVSGDCQWWNLILSANGSYSYDTGIAAQPFTIGGKNDVVIPNADEIEQLANKGNASIFNYPPFKITGTAINQRLITSTQRPSVTTNHYYALPQDTTIRSVQLKSVLGRVLFTRIGNTSEL